MFSATLHVLGTLEYKFEILKIDWVCCVFAYFVHLVNQKIHFEKTWNFEHLRFLIWRIQKNCLNLCTTNLQETWNSIFRILFLEMCGKKFWQKIQILLKILVLACFCDFSFSVCLRKRGESYFFGQKHKQICENF